MSKTSSKTKLFELEDPPRSIADLPPPDTKRWVVRRKASVVYAVEHGLIELDDACRRYGISLEEYESWRRLLKRHGIGGLRVTRLGDYRDDAEGDTQQT
ncbi:MAG: DUF1153 domain-containing protein [Rickettsiales bacterium]|jgi:hypothetical protein